MAKKKHQDSANEQGTASPNKGSATHQVEMDIEHHVQTSSVFSNHLIAQADPDSIYLSFFQVNPPFVFVPGGTDEDKLAALRKSGKLVAECVAKVAVPRSKIAAFIEVINKTASRVETGDTVEIKVR